jgi:hypothetical protein
LSVEINSVEINSAAKLEYLALVLKEFLPAYLTNDGKETTSNRVFFIFYTYQAAESPDAEKFDAFIKTLIEAIALPTTLKAISSLDDITKTDTRNWLEVFVKVHDFDEDEVDDMLQVAGNPFKKFKMKEVNRLIKDWLKKNLFNN